MRYGITGRQYTSPSSHICLLNSFWNPNALNLARPVIRCNNASLRTNCLFFGSNKSFSFTYSQNRFVTCKRANEREWTPTVSEHVLAVRA